MSEPESQYDPRNISHSLTQTARPDQGQVSESLNPERVSLSRSSHLVDVSTGRDDTGTLATALDTGNTTAPARPVRRARGNVPTACNNCKRAHLGCDANRPCTRCVQSGREETCADVPQKKRGRPKIRGQSSSSVRAEDVPQAPILPATSPRFASRYPGPMRHGSLHSLTSMGSLGSPSAAPSPPDVHETRSSTSPRARRTRPSALEVNSPQAWLDLDLNIISTNRAFDEFFGRQWFGTSVNLSEVASPNVPDGFRMLQARLRDERESKDPSYMPPITPQRQSPQPPASPQDTSITFGSFVMPLSVKVATGHGPEISASFQLAKTNRYYVVITIVDAPTATGGGSVGSTTRGTIGGATPIWRVPQAPIPGVILGQEPSRIVESPSQISGMEGQSLSSSENPSWSTRSGSLGTQPVFDSSMFQAPRRPLSAARRRAMMHEARTQSGRQRAISDVSSRQGTSSSFGAGPSRPITRGSGSATTTGMSLTEESGVVREQGIVRRASDEGQPASRTRGRSLTGSDEEGQDRAKRRRMDISSILH